MGDEETNSDEPQDDNRDAAARAADDADWRDSIRTQREQLPETALALMDAIRQAAVTQQLTRQITRLLIIAGEFLAERREVTPRAQEKAQIALARTEELLQQAIASRSFAPDDQKELARRIRRRRKELEALLGSD